MKAIVRPEVIIFNKRLIAYVLKSGVVSDSENLFTHEEIDKILKSETKLGALYYLQEIMDSKDSVDVCGEHYTGYCQGLELLKLEASSERLIGSIIYKSNLETEKLFTEDIDYIKTLDLSNAEFYIKSDLSRTEYKGHNVIDNGEYVFNQIATQTTHWIKVDEVGEDDVQHAMVLTPEAWFYYPIYTKLASVEFGKYNIYDEHRKLDEFVMKNFDVLYEGATRLGVNIPEDIFTVDRVQINGTCLHRLLGLKIAGGWHHFNDPISKLSKKALVDTVEDLKTLLSAYNKEKKCGFRIEIIEE